jgi:alanine racemase
MDMMFVDIGLDSEVNINDEVVLWGKGLPVEHIAQRVGTIPYELLTRVTKRVKYIYN